MDGIRNWAMTLSAVIVFGTLAESILPGGSYRKYIHLVLAILLLISVISPVISIFGGRAELPELPQSGYSGSNYSTERERLEYKQQKDVINIYTRTLESNLKIRLETKFPELKDRFDVRLTADEESGMIMHAAVITDGLTDSADEIKKQTAEVLGISANDVSVTA